ncbi:MAG TPA: feruloyl-CoA synthase [Burkholderiales bacterium]
MHDTNRMFAPVAVEMEHRADGAMLLRSLQPLANYARCIGEYLEHWGLAASSRPFLFERGPDGRWVGAAYGEALKQVRQIAAWLLKQNLSPERPVVVLSGNGVEHGLISLAAMHIGVPILPISPSYALMSKDFGKLKFIFGLVKPGVIFVADHAPFAPALAALSSMHDAQLVVGSRSESAPGAVSFSTLLDASNEGAVDRALAAVTPDTVAKLLFTSGSTGEPKGVINTQRMLCANQQQMIQVWPFLDDEPPVIVDWLVWNHTFGANHNFNMILRHGGTLYIDGGRPMPNLFQQSLANLRDVAPTVYFNVPRGFDMLVAALRTDEALRRHFFSRLKLIFYAAAALPQNLWEALEKLSLEALGYNVPMVSSWGLTETAPAVTTCHFQAERSGVIGVPLPGCELKLLANGDKLEIRVRGPNVTPGYWKRPDLTAKAFDKEGFCITGDAMRFVDPKYPEKGLLFDGRVAEDFKLSSGTWVNADAVRLKAVALMAPIVQDIALTGHDLDEIGFLIFPNVAACRQLCPDLTPDAPVAQVLTHANVRTKILAGMTAMKRDDGGSSTYATRALLLAEPPSGDAGEITDKGNINQRAVRTRRATLVEMLHRTPIDPAVIALADARAPAGKHPKRGA